MNKQELVEVIQKELGSDCSKAEAERALDAVIEAIKKGIKKAKKDGIQLIGFGSFKVAQRAAREGVNPRTGAKIKIKASKTVKFKPGAELKKCAAAA